MAAKVGALHHHAGSDPKVCAAQECVHRLVSRGATEEWPSKSTNIKVVSTTLEQGLKLTFVYNRGVLPTYSLELLGRNRILVDARGIEHLYGFTTVCTVLIPTFTLVRPLNGIMIKNSAQPERSNLHSDSNAHE